MKQFLSMLLLVVATNVYAAPTPATWSSFTATSATGELNGKTITATSTAGAPIVGFMAAFDNTWDGSMPLGPNDLGLVVSNVNAGDSQTFSFSSPLVDGTLMYIENFDSSSLALFTFTGATGTALVDNSPSIFYQPVDPDMGVMLSTNQGFNGEGDAVIELSGAVTEIQVDFLSGIGANGVMYTFVEPMANGTGGGGSMGDPHAVPEPTSAMVMAGLFGLGGGVACIRRKRK